MAHFALVGGIILALVYLLYRWALPKPLPGIPYNEAAVNSLFGDIPGLMADLKRHGDIFIWFRDQNLRSGSVISQIFPLLFGKPAVIVADAHEARDMLANRSADFDRTTSVSEFFRPLIGKSQITFPTGPKWKSLRRLSQDTMSPRFLKNVAAPNIHASCSALVQLWEQKARLAAGRPFEAELDLFHVTLDAVAVFNFGGQYPHRALQPELDGLQALSPGDVKRGESLDEPATFPHFKIAQDLQDMVDLIARAEAVQDMGLQALGWHFEKMTSRYKKLKKSKDESIRREIVKALERMESLDEIAAEETARHGVDLILNRERIMAGKENRQPDYFGDAVLAEIFGAIVGGHDTTSSSMCWVVKLLCKERANQTALRQALQSAYATAMEERRQPTVEEVLNTPLPYLDAVIEELFRLCAVVPINSRIAIRDTEVMGHPIPKGTMVIHLSNGPGFTMPSCKIDKTMHPSSAKVDRVKSWDDDDIHVYKPERWLVQGANGETKCDPNAGPSMGFGAGLRSCFGKRLGYMSFRLLLVSIIWNFELLECPEELSSPLGKFGVVYKPQQTYVRLRKVEL